MSDTPRPTTANPPAVHVDRRRVLGAFASGALLAGLHRAAAAQPATPSAVDPAQLRSLSQALCGGGVFDDGRTAQLAGLLATDPTLRAGLDELMRDAAASPSPGSRSTAAQAAAQEILLYWYAGEFKGEPVANHAAVYTRLQAWQAMYTPAWTTCKVYGAWADPPVMTPQQPEIA